MFSTLSDKFTDAFRKLSGQANISESNVKEAMQDVRAALLEADVHYDVVEKFCAATLEKSLGADVLKSVKPGQQMIKLVYDQLVDLMGNKDDQAGIMFVTPGPTIIMMCGLQGSGKTTTCGKLAAKLKQQGKNVMLCAADLQRPAAVTQLQVLSEQVSQMGGGGQIYFYSEPDKIAEYGKAVGVAPKVCKNALAAAKSKGADVLILDTAGRLHINDTLMDELKQVNTALNPHQIYLVIDAMTGQDAVNSAKAFNQQLELDGIILTKFDSDTRGGAALSVKTITGKPIKYIGVGEKLDAIEEFHADRIASRILGMGDVVSLVEKAQAQVSEAEAQEITNKMAEGTLTLDDFLSQLRKIRAMGPMKNLLGLLPGIGTQLQGMDIDERQIDRTEAIIKSMTTKERKQPAILDNGRRRRISKGSGTHQEDVSRLVKGFTLVSQASKQIASQGMLSRLKSMAGMSPAQMQAMVKSGPPKLEAAKPKFKIRKRK